MQYTINEERQPEYEAILKNRLGFMLLVARFSEEKRARSFVEKLQSSLGLPLKVREDVELDSIDRKQPFKPFPLFIPDGSSIRVFETREEASINWKVQYHPVQAVFMLGVYYGFFHIINHLAFPLVDINSIAGKLLYGAMGLILSLIVIRILASFSGRIHIVITKEEICTFKKVFGRKTYEHKMNKNDLAVLRSTIEPSNETIIVASRKGIEALNRLIKSFKPREKDIKKMIEVDDIVSIRDEIIRLDVSTLKLIEKLYIDQFILKNL